MIARLLLATITLGTAASAAGAADDHYLDPELATGTRFKMAAESPTAAEGRIMQKQIARCVLSLKGEKVRAMLAHSDFNSIDFAAIDEDPDALFDDLDVDNCMERAMQYGQFKLQMRMPFATLRNLLAEEVYLKDHGRAVAPARDAQEKIDARYQTGRLDGRTAVLNELGDCISFNGALPAHELLRSQPGSKSEREAFAALAPTLGKCLKSDKPMEIQSSLVRQVVADGMWARGFYSGGETAK